MSDASLMELRHYRRVGAEECHYNGYLMSGAHIIQYASDVIGELSIRRDGDGGLLASVEQARFLQPVFAGETLEITVRVIHVGNRSRKVSFEVRKHIRKRFDISRGAAEVLDPPVLVADGTAVVVIPKKEA